MKKKKSQKRKETEEDSDNAPMFNRSSEITTSQNFIRKKKTHWK